MLASYGKILAIASLSLRCSAFTLHANATGDSTFMLVAGTTASDEVCLIQNAGGLSLDSCSSAIAAGDGRELWSFQSGGQLMNAITRKCASGAALTMSECGGASSWKMLPNGQVQVGGEQCLSQTGAGAGTENVAAHAAAFATSSANAVAHAAAAAVDGDEATFWASRPGEAGQVAFTVDLGEVRSISLMKIKWEFPAQSFALAVSLDGKQWTEVFSTTVNMVKTSRIPLSLIAASSVRIEMRKPHPLAGLLSGKPLFGIKSLAILAPRLAVSLDDCAAAALSKDARDKYFAVSVGQFDAAPSAALQAEMPALAAAKASVSAALSDVANAGAKLSGCAGTSSFAAGGLVAQSARQRLVSSGRSVDATSGFDEGDVKTLLASARSTILGVRSALR